MNTLKGFSLIEVLVAIALIAVLLYLGVFVYQHMGSYSSRYVQEADRAYCSMILYEVVEADCQQARAYDIQQGNSLLLLFAQDSSEVRYRLHEGELLRAIHDRLDSLGTMMTAFEALGPFHFSLIDSLGRHYTFSLGESARLKRTN